MTEGEATFLVLQIEDGRFFREQLRSKFAFESKPNFLFVKHLACARGFPITDAPLAESFRRFLGVNGYKATIFVTAKNRLLRLYERPPYPLRVPRSQEAMALIDLKKVNRHFRVV